MTLEPLRLFIAADITPTQRQACAKILHALRTGVQFTRAHPKWVDPGHMHLTLKFLGAVDPDRLGAIHDAVAARLTDAAPGLVRLRGLGVFPNEREPKVLWLGLTKGADYLQQLQERVEQALEPLGFPRDKRPFHPHLTLARINSMRDLAPLMAIVKSHQNAEAGEADIDRLVLYQSTLLPAGPVYRALREWPMHAPA